MDTYTIMLGLWILTVVIFGGFVVWWLKAHFSKDWTPDKSIVPTIGALVCAAISMVLLMIMRLI